MRLHPRQRGVRDGPEEAANGKTLEDLQPWNLASDLCLQKPTLAALQRVV